MYIDYKSPFIRFTGRFAELNNSMTATACGSEMEIAFKGQSILLSFDLDGQQYPFPHIWLQLDNGDLFEAQLDWYLRVNSANYGKHTIKIILKSTLESQNRWKAIPAAKISFRGAETEEFLDLPPDNRKTIEFIGDSITEGVLIDSEKQPISPESECRTFQDDVLATYAHLTAENLDLRAYHVGYGAVGFTRGGSGGVPAVNESYDYCFENAPVSYGHPDYILINHGTNDRGAKEAYISRYREFLEKLIKVHPNSKIIVLTGFSGVYPKETGKMVDTFNSEHKTDILFIDSTGWIPPEPLHPDRAGHKIVAEHLTQILNERI